jgi:hypothetical protein
MQLLTPLKRNVDPDAQWFADHPERRARIRNAVKVLHIDKQRRTFYMDECKAEFEALGDHDKDRRRILLWKVPHDNPYYRADKPPLLKIPMLAFADETIEDSDAVLLPIIHDLMMDNAKRYGAWKGSA